MKKISLIFLLGLLLPNIVFADIYNSSNYKIVDPVLNGANYSTSSSFKLESTMSQPAIGESSATSFGAKAGFLYFPVVRPPVLSGTAGNTASNLNWTSAQGFLGWVVSSYVVGRSNTPLGPYTYLSPTGSLSMGDSGLTNGTTYYYVVVARDFFGNSLATSSEIALTPTGSSSTGGGGVSNGMPIAYIPNLLIPIEKIAECKIIADLDCDGYVDIVDFSIMYYWFGKDNPPLRVDLSRDGKVDIRDFSIMAYYWKERPRK